MIKPMLACSTMITSTQLRYPVYASYKMDGIRALAVHGVAMSRNGKPIPNKYIQSWFKQYNLHGFDGEIMLRDRSKDFNEVQSAVMSEDGTPDFEYIVFDQFNLAASGFASRSATAIGNVVRMNEKTARIYFVVQERCDSAYELERLYKLAIEKGYEGLITRDMRAPYKHGRSTLNQQWMMKFKAVMDVEGEILNIEELEHNLDTSTKMKDNMIGGDTLGAFVVRLDNGVIVKVGTGKGLTTAKRKELWMQRKSLIGRRMTLAYQELSADGVPRFPRFKGFRDGE